jgi:hypothetical protein
MASFFRTARSSARSRPCIDASPSYTTGWQEQLSGTLVRILGTWGCRSMHTCHRLCCGLGIQPPAHSCMVDLLFCSVNLRINSDCLLRRIVAVMLLL